MSKPLSPKAIATLKHQIWRLPPVDAVCLLTSVVMASKAGSPAGAVIGLVELAGRLAVQLSSESRFRIAERLRSIADRLEAAFVDEASPC